MHKKTKKQKKKQSVYCGYALEVSVQGASDE